MTSQQPRIAILLMAAGGSSRLGRPKQLLPFRDTTLLQHLTQEAVRSAAAAVHVVVGVARTMVTEHLSGSDVTIVPNDRWSGGLSTSIQAGLRSIPDSTEGIIIMLCDMPHVTSDHLTALIERQGAGRKGIIASRYGDSPGVPALFMRPYFGELRNLQGDMGAKSIVLRHGGDADYVDLPGGEVDIDTKEDVHSLSGRQD